jgi:hypothetical protein
MIAVLGSLILAVQTHLIVVTGLSGEPQYATAFAKLGTALVDHAKLRWGVRDSGLVYLAERPAADPTRITGRATREAVLAAVGQVARRAAKNDVVLILLIGHGSEQGDEARFNLPGPDLTATDLAQAISALSDQTVLVVNAASASGGFLKPLAGPHRVVITATKTGFERNATMFGDFFVKALISAEADADKNGQVSAAEAFQYAGREVARAYETAKRLLTEHAQLEDGEGGALARAVGFVLSTDTAADDPRAATLVAERRRLEAAIAELRGRKARTDSTAYQRDLEQLLVKLAETNQAIRAIQGKTP